MIINLIPTVYAADLGTQYGFGGADFSNVGRAFSHLVVPGFAVAAAIVTISLIAGGFKYLTSGGEKEEVAAAKNLISHAIIGFVILIFVFLILRFIPDYFGLEGFRIIQ